MSLSELNDLVKHVKPSACPLDVVPTRLLKETMPTVGPFISSIINSSLISGLVPAYFKTALVKPLLKKPNLDPSTLNNYRPVSKLPFLSKILEKAVLKQ